MPIDVRRIFEIRRTPCLGSSSEKSSGFSRASRDTGMALEGMGSERTARAAVIRAEPSVDSAIVPADPIHREDPFS
jgi:hypothetical protein